MLYIILFVAYFCFTCCLFHSESSASSSYIPETNILEQPDFYTQVSELMTDEPLPETETITTLGYQQLMKVPMEVIKAVASEMNIDIKGNKSQICSRLKNQLTQQDIKAKLQLT